MSDVSGIPYMGPMGMGGFFSNPFGNGGMSMSAGQISQPYMPEINNNQNVVQNLFNTPGGGGGFGRATDYYSQLGAQYSAAGMSPFGVFSEGGGGGGGASPYQTSPDVWNTGASGFSYPGAGMVDWSMFGGGGASPYQTSPNVFSQGASPFQYGGAGLDWSSLYKPQQSMSGPDFGAGMFGGLAGGIGGTYQGQNNQMNWGNLFSGGGGGGGMTMPGGLNSPMTMPQQQPLDYGSLFGRGAGGMGSGATADPYPAMSMPGGLNSPMSGMDAPMEGAPSSTMDWSTLFGGDTGMTMPGGLNSPMTVPESQAPAYDYGSLFGKGTEGAAPPAPDGTRTYDLAPMFEGGGGGFGTGGADSQLFGGEATGQGGNAFSYNPEPTGAQDVFGQSVDALAEQARARLAGLMGGQDDRAIELKVDPQDKVAPEQPVAPAEAPAEPPAVTPGATVPATDLYPGDNPPRPPADIKQGTGLRDSPTLKGVNPRLTAAVAGGATFLPPGYTVGAVSGVREGKEQAYHRGGRAMDVQIFDPNGNAIPHKGEDKTGLYTMLAQGTKAWVQQNDPQLMQTMRYGGAFGTVRGGGGVPDLMHYDLGLWPGKENYGAMRPEVGFGVLKPMSAEDQRASLGSQIQSGIGAEAQRYAEGPNAPLAERSANATVEERPGVNQGQDITPPPADIPPPGLVGPGFNALDAAAKHTGLELARANIDTPIEKIAMERGGQKAVDQVSSMAVGMTPRQLQQSYGGMFMSRAEPLFASLGITRQDFEQAAKMPPTRQDIKMRFGEGGDFGPYPAFTGYEAAPGDSGGAYADFRRSPNVEDMRGELANLQPREFGYGDLPEVTPTPLSDAAGLGELPMPPTDIGTPGATDFSSQSRRDMPDRGMDPSYWADVLDDDAEGASFNERFTGDAGVRDFQSPANDYSMFQQQPFIDPWQASIPAGRNSPEVVDAVKAMAARLRTDPATVAATIQQETHDNSSALWNPQIKPNSSGFRGLTQMGRDTFTDAAKAGMPIGDFPTIEDYQRGTAEQQIAAYGDWLDLYTLQNPQGAAAFINSGGLEGLPPDVAAAFMQGTQFAPNASKWARAFEQGNRDMPTTRTDQAEELRPFTINSMTDVARRHMAAWPQQQLWSDYNMPRRPGGY